MLRRTVLALIALTATVAVPATAAPPGPDSAETSPFSGQDTLTCTQGATCTVTTTAPSSGPDTVSADYARQTPAGGSEFSFGYAGQSTSVKVPPGATTASATFVWLVSGASSTASSASGRLFSTVGVAAWAPSCQDPCTSTPQAGPVLRSSSSAGLPAASSGNGAPQTVTLHVTATGKLTRWLRWVTYAYVDAGGQAWQLCPSPSGSPCQAVQADHAGTAHGEITATLQSSTYSFS